MVLTNASEPAVAAHALHALHALHAAQILVHCTLLLVLIHPAVKVGLEEVQPGLVLGQARPVLVLGLLLAQYKHDVARSVLCFALGRVDFIVQLQFDVVCGVLRCRFARHGQRRRLQLYLEILVWHIGRKHCQVDYVLFIIGRGGTLGPAD